MKVAELETAVDKENNAILIYVQEGRKKSTITISRESAIVLKDNLQLAVEILDEEE